MKNIYLLNDTLNDALDDTFYEALNEAQNNTMNDPLNDPLNGVELRFEKNGGEAKSRGSQAGEEK